MPQSLVKFGGRCMSTTLPLDARAESAASGKVLPRLLIVEDDAMVGILLCDVLEKDYDIVHVASSKEALRALAEQHIDVILLDYILPDGCGDEVASRANKMGLPMAWMTGHPASVGKLSADSRPLLLKPFGIYVILEVMIKVRNVL
jgi:DNA-binding response OmpR family regulator